MKLASLRIGLQLKVARVESELDQKEVEKKTGIAQSTISEIEAGKTNPQASTIERLADCYGYKLIITPKGA